MIRYQRRLNRQTVAPIAAAFFVLWPLTASAHLVNSGLGPFYDGALHLLLSPGDLLAVVAFALFAGLSGAKAGRWTSVMLPFAWFTAGLVGMQIGPGVALPWLNILSFVILGVMVAANVRLPAITVALAAVLVGTLYGLVDGAALSASGAGWPALSGIVLTVLVCVLLGSALVVSLRSEWSRIALRVAGSWVAAVGMLMSGWLLQATG